MKAKYLIHSLACIASIAAGFYLTAREVQAESCPPIRCTCASYVFYRSDPSCPEGSRAYMNWGEGLLCTFCCEQDLGCQTPP